MSTWYCGWFGPIGSHKSEPKNNYEQAVREGDIQFTSPRKTVIFTSIGDARKFFKKFMYCDHIAEFDGTDFIRFHEVKEKTDEDKLYEKLELMLDSGEDSDEIIDCVKEYIESTKEKAE